ncbi:hypothetical protein [Salinibius halmophilus]|uniref:hypothetical protein n=1 Tax=Salinibius halmophilus TaxID=1853216 RepID=UPI000E65EF7C|nr:hypothetical protein [Salinibius halmophilus]
MYQFLTDESVVTHIKLTDATAEEEKRQLMDQGFKLVGDPIEANDARHATALLKERSQNEWKSFALVTIATGLIVSP